MTWRVLDHAGDEGTTPVDDAVRRGVTLLLAGDEEGAAAAFDRALERSPDHPEATYDRAVLAWDRGELADDEVVRRLQAVRESHLGSGRATWLLGLALNERRGPGRAAAAFEKAARQGCVDEAPEPAPSWFGAPTGRRPRCLRTFTFPGRTAASVAVAPRSRRALVATNELVHVIDLDDLAVRATLTFDDTVECTAVFDGDRPLGFAGGLDRTVRVIDLESAECLRELEGHRRGVMCLAASPDGRRLVTGSSDGRLRVFDVATGACAATFGERAAKVVAWNGDDEVVSGSADGVIHCWAPGSSACLSADGRLCLASCDPDVFDVRDSRVTNPSLQLWDLGPRERSFRPVRCRPRDAGEVERQGRALVAHLDAARAALAARDAAAVHAAVTAARAIPGHAEDRDANELAIAAATQLDRTLVGPRAVWPRPSIDVAGAVHLELGSSSTLRVFDRDRRLLRAIDLATSRVVDVAPTADMGAPISLSPQGRFALTSDDGRLTVWELGQGSPRRVSRGFDPGLEYGCAALSPDGRTVLLGGGLDVALHVFDATTGRRVHHLPAYGWGVGAIRVSADGRLAVTGGAAVRVGGRPPEGSGYPDDGFGLRVLDLATGRWTKAIRDDGCGSSWALRFDLSHCGRWALATARGGLRLIDLVDGTDRWLLDLPRSPDRLAWNGRYAVSGAIGEDRLRVFEFDWDFDPRPRGDR